MVPKVMKEFMIIVRQKVTLQTLKEMAQKMHGNLVKAVVDVDKKIMALDAELHADQERLLLEHESKQQYLWGINIYPDQTGQGEWIEFDSMINLRPSQGNKSRSVEDIQLQTKIKEIVHTLVEL